MKPQWKDAPDWANWLAQDYNGQWFWYENEPIMKNIQWWPANGAVDSSTPDNPNWQETLEERPKDRRD